ncbi:MAG: hypothetical protein JO077_00135 [Verrucomicrobia bacterium]|nr:hypothetical protein [Verrucomicrobiota bacterium]
MLASYASFDTKGGVHLSLRVIVERQERPQALSATNGFTRLFVWRALLSPLLFLIIPILFVVAVAQLTKAKGPQWLPYSFENPYAYLFNSLLVVEGQPPVYIDHPGTTTEMFGGVVLRMSSLKTAEDLIYSSLVHPEIQIKRLHWALLISSALCLWIVPWLTAIALKSQVTGLLIQAPTLFSQTLLFYGILFGSDLMVVPFSIAAVCCCLLLSVPSSVPEKLEVMFGVRIVSPTPNSPQTLRLTLLPLPALTGLVCAFGIVTKLTFFPLILISLLCCRSGKNLLAFAISFLCGLAFALLPIYSQLWRLVNWAFGLIVHSGKYSTGDIGLPEASVYLSSLSNLIQTEPLIVVTPLVATVVLLAFSLLAKKKLTLNKIDQITLLAVFVIQVISLLVIAKENGSHYLIPLFITTGLNLAFLFHASRSIDDSRLRKTVGWIALLGLLALGLKGFIEDTPATYAQLRDGKIDLLRLYHHAKEITKNDVRVDYFFSDSPEFPLCYGNEYAGSAFGQQLARIYGNPLFLDVFGKRFQTFTDSIEPSLVLQRYDHLYFLGKPKWLPQIDGFDPATFETIDRAGDFYLQKWTRK